jgi:hypothetical protein
LIARHPSDSLSDSNQQARQPANTAPIVPMHVGSLSHPRVEDKSAEEKAAHNAIPT